MHSQSKFAQLVAIGFFAAALAVAGSLPGFAQDKEKCETIDANAAGTSTQMGRLIPVKVRICAFSSPEDRQVLVNAFRQGQNEGLVKALEKMKSVGRISLPGTTGYDISFARVIPTPTGRKIRFVTNRKIAFGEARSNSRSQAFSLTAGEFDLNDQDKDKSTGVLFPATQFVINGEGELQLELNQNPWKLNNIIDWSAKDKD